MKKLGFVLLCLTSLASCRTTVPDPSVPLHTLDKPLPKYKMHNIGPQQASQSRAIHFTDMNQDGHPDLLVGGHENIDGFHIEWGDGTGNWTLQGGPLTAMQPRTIATADIDHDRLSLVLASPSEEMPAPLMADLFYWDEVAQMAQIEDLNEIAGRHGLVFSDEVTIEEADEIAEYIIAQF